MTFPSIRLAPPRPLRRRRAKLQATKVESHQVQDVAQDTLDTDPIKMNDTPKHRSWLLSGSKHGTQKRRRTTKDRPSASREQPCRPHHQPILSLWTSLSKRGSTVLGAVVSRKGSTSSVPFNEDGTNGNTPNHGEGSSSQDGEDFADQTGHNPVPAPPVLMNPSYQSCAATFVSAATAASVRMEPQDVSHTPSVEEKKDHEPMGLYVDQWETCQLEDDEALSGIAVAAAVVVGNHNDEAAERDMKSKKSSSKRHKTKKVDDSEKIIGMIITFDPTAHLLRMDDEGEPKSVTRTQLRELQKCEDYGDSLLLGKCVTESDDDESSRSSWSMNDLNVTTPSTAAGDSGGSLFDNKGHKPIIHNSNWGHDAIATASQPQPHHTPTLPVDNSWLWNGYVPQVPIHDDERRHLLSWRDSQPQISSSSSSSSCEPQVSSPPKEEYEEIEIAFFKDPEGATCDQEVLFSLHTDWNSVDNNDEEEIEIEFFPCREDSDESSTSFEECYDWFLPDHADLAAPIPDQNLAERSLLPSCTSPNTTKLFSAPMMVSPDSFEGYDDDDENDEPLDYRVGLYPECGTSSIKQQLLNISSMGGGDDNTSVLSDISGASTAVENLLAVCNQSRRSCHPHLPTISFPRCLVTSPHARRAEFELSSYQKAYVS
jgi:hypothetical protein